MLKIYMYVYQRASKSWIDKFIQFPTGYLSDISI